MEIKPENYIEKIVREELDSLYKRDTTICKCPNCYQDIMTLTLNNLPAMYVSSDIGHIMTMFNLSKDQLQAQVLVELLKAIEKVRQNPRH
ncbi:MAG: late competence development ComFB family protein [candidate division WOR-3 bacterium]|nr:late competence development ComFB family protein [candidate division WOR-3 bacterium]